MSTDCGADALTTVPGVGVCKIIINLLKSRKLEWHQKKALYHALIVLRGNGSPTNNKRQQPKTWCD